MKANEAPEKVYFSVIENGTHYFTEGIPFEREYIEYIRTDAFIEKVEKYLQEHLIDYWSQSVTNESKFIEDLKNYMKGE